MRRQQYLITVALELQALLHAVCHLMINSLELNRGSLMADIAIG
jgi:hypothetical protein